MALIAATASSRSLPVKADRMQRRARNCWPSLASPISRTVPPPDGPGSVTPGPSFVSRTTMTPDIMMAAAIVVAAAAGIAWDLWNFPE